MTGHDALIKLGILVIFFGVIFLGYQGCKYVMIKDHYPYYWNDGVIVKVFMTTKKSETFVLTPDSFLRERETEDGKHRIVVIYAPKYDARGQNLTGYTVVSVTIDGEEINQGTPSSETFSEIFSFL